MRESEGVLPNTLALGYAVCGYVGGFALMPATPWWANAIGVLLTAHAMVIAAYLIHEAAHYNLFARAEHNRLAGELMSFIAGGAYVSFERIRHLHLRHHRDRLYEQANTYSNVVSARHPWLNLLTINFGYHNAHHERASVPWYRLPALHRELFGASKRELMSVPEVLRSFHRNRLKRVLDDDYGSVGEGPDRADRYVGAHGVSFLTVV
jgi:fatty acid desaturase